MPKQHSLLQPKSLTPRLKLRAVREAVGWSQEELGKRLGSGQVTVSRWETGETTPSPYFREKLCRFFGKTPEDLDLERRDPLAAASTSEAASGTYDPLIPPLLAPLVGREQEMASLRARLYAGQQITTLTAVNGLPGVGKTALAVALAHDPEMRAHFSDGILWAGLGTTPDLVGQLRRWASLFGLHETQTDSRGIDTLALMIHSAIGERRMLLVIDDVWVMEEALTFQIGGTHCVYLMTTRFPHIASQLASVDPMLLHELSNEQSLDLLHLLAPQVVEQEAEKAQILAQTVGGLPLALTLIGNYLRRQAASGQRRRIQAALEQLSQVETRLHLSEPCGPVSRHPGLPSEQSLSLHAVIALSDQHLSEEARRALYALAVLPHKPSSFSEAAALVVSASCVCALDDLIDTGLLENGGDGRYSLHQTIADYASICLTDTQPQQRLIQYAHDVVQAHRTNYELLDQESETILAALETAYKMEKKEELVCNVCDFISYLLVHGNYSLAERHIQRAYQAAVALKDHRSLITTLLYRGQIAQKQGNYPQAEADFQQALVIAHQSNDPERISAVLRDLGWVSWKRGNYVQAEASLKEGLALARRIDDPERISDVLQTLGALVGNLGDYRQETVYLQEGLALARTIGDRERICKSLIHLGIAFAEVGNHVQAERLFQEGLEVARQIGHKEWSSALLVNLGEIGSVQGNYTQAESYIREGLTLAEQIGHKEWSGALFVNLGQATTLTQPC